MSDSLRQMTTRWLLPEGPEPDIVVSSRCRLARNLAGVPFSRHAAPAQLVGVVRRVREAMGGEPALAGFIEIPLAEVSSGDRALLREAHLISHDLERHAEHCAVFLSPDGFISIMVNEEDHLRMHAITSGYRVREAHRRIDDVDDVLSHRLTFAFSPRLGFLTACPTNTGTGLRASVMLHLPGLVLAGKIERIVKEISGHGFAVRGFYGEGTNCAGDLYQISNEVTLGKSEGDILTGLLAVIDQIIDRERRARHGLFEKRTTFVEDSIWRSYATLSQARMINSSEAISLLSRLRLGIDRGHFNQRLTHQDLNRLLIEIQPAHLMADIDPSADSEARDAARAAFLRSRLGDIVSSN